MKKLRWMPVWLGLVLLTLSACSPQDNLAKEDAASYAATADEVATSNSHLVFAGERVSTINPLLNTFDELPSLVFSGLMRRGSGGQLEGDLAERFVYNDTELSYTFYLKPQVYWHDGTPFTAQDVVFTYELLLSPAGQLCPVRSNFNAITQVEALDEHTVKFFLKEPQAALLGYFSLGILPKRMLQGQDLAVTSFNQAPIGTGRYRVVAWDMAAARIELSAFTDFYGPKPKLTHLTYCTVGDEQTKSLMLKSGAADVAWLNAHYAAQFRDEPSYVNYDFPTADLRAIAFDFHTPFCQEQSDSLAVLNLAINKDLLVQTVLNGRGVRAFSPLQLSSYGGNLEADLYPYDKARFADEMTRLGWQRGEDGIYVRNGQRFSFRVQVREYEQERVDLAQLCSSMLREAGVEMKIVRVPHFDWQSGYEATLWAMAAPFDPDELYSALVSGMSDNNMAYSNAEVDRLLTAARLAQTQQERRSLYQAFEVAYAKLPSALPLVFFEGNYVAKRGLIGLNTQRLLGHHAAGVMWNIEEWSWE